MNANKKPYHLRKTKGHKLRGSGKKAVYKPQFYFTVATSQVLGNGETYTRKQSAIEGAMRMFNAHSVALDGWARFDPRNAEDRRDFVSKFMTDHTNEEA